MALYQKTIIFISINLNTENSSYPCQLEMTYSLAKACLSMFLQN